MAAFTSPEGPPSLDRLVPATVRVDDRHGENQATLARPPVVSQSEWDAALTALLGASGTSPPRCTTRGRTETHADGAGGARLRVQGPHGERSLPELFDGRSQLILYRFFFEEGVRGWPDAGCVGCSSVADGIPELGLLHARDITFAMASPAPQANLRRYAERMGWTDVPWYTIRTRALFGGLRGRRVVRLQRLSATATTSTAPISSSTERCQWIGSLWSLWSLTPYGGQSDDEDLPEGGRGRRGRSGSAATTSSTSRRHRPAWASTRTIDPSSVRHVAEPRSATSGRRGIAG